jgi:2-methylcitrate dehydratase PrpD
VSAAPIAERLAAELVAFGARPLPADVEQRAVDLLRDYLGVTLGGAPEPSSLALRRGLTALGTTGAGTVIGTAASLAPVHAALANGAAAHALEMDDTHQGGSIHLGAAVFSAALAAAELHGASGARVLGAVVAGYEVAARLAMALGPAAHYARGFHPTGTCGAFGAAAASALVAGLQANQLACALGIAGSQAAGSMEFLAAGTWTKRLHPGWAACAGLHAAALAGAGFRAPHTIFEGRFGTLHAYSDGATVEPLAGRPGGELMRTSIKPHACCRYAQGPIDAVLELRRRHGLRAETVVRLEVGLVSAGFAIVCEPLAQKRRPRSVVDAQFSLPFSVAVALVAGAASPDEFTAARFDDPVVQRLMDVVEPQHDAALDARYPDVWPVWVRATTRDGAVHEARVDHPRGDPENFPTRDELGEKFRRLAGRTLEAAAIARLEAAIDAFARAPHAADLLALAQAAGK